jgi:hypothetical protein
MSAHPTLRIRIPPDCPNTIYYYNDVSVDIDTAYMPYYFLRVNKYIVPGTYFEKRKNDGSRIAVVKKQDKHIIIKEYLTNKQHRILAEFNYIDGNLPHYILLDDGDYVIAFNEARSCRFSLKWYRSWGGAFIIMKTGYRKNDMYYIDGDECQIRSIYEYMKNNVSCGVFKLKVKI